MWAEAVERMLEAERLHRQFFGYGDTTACWEPPLDIVGRQDELLITVALPGVAPDMVKVAIDGVSLTITALRPAPIDGTTHIHRLEIPYGRFERRITLPPARYDLVEQRFQHGCLSLRLIRQG
jgi:HSP20 family molecular chaperone IbpA